MPDAQITGGLGAEEEDPNWFVSLNDDGDDRNGKTDLEETETLPAAHPSSSSAGRQRRRCEKRRPKSVGGWCAQKMRDGQI
jgi:hypothetical protein